LDEKIKGQWQKFGPECAATVWKACHSNSQFEQTVSLQTYSRKSMNFSDSHHGKVEH
jgi:hypothetical protein